MIRACGGCLSYYACIFAAIGALGTGIYYFQEGDTVRGAVGVAIGAACIAGAFLANRWMGSQPAVGAETAEGIEHRKVHPLVCRMGEDGDRHLRAGRLTEARMQYLKVLYYLAGSQLIDQFLLGKAYLGLMMVEAQNGAEALQRLVENPAEGLTGAMEVAGVMSTPAHHVFQTAMLSPADHKLYHDLVDYAQGRRPAPPADTMSPWDLRLAAAEQFPVAHLGGNVIAAVLEKSAPPVMTPELDQLELDIEVPGRL